MPIDIFDNNPVQTEIRTGNVFKTYGGTAIRFNVAAYRTMSLEAFKTDVLPKLQPMTCDKNMSYYVIRDLSHNTCYCLLPDCVEEFRVSDWHETDTNEVIRELKQLDAHNKDIEIVLDLPVPILKYKYNELYWTIVAKMPHTKFMYRSDMLENFIGNGIMINMPQCVFSVKANNNSVVQSARVYVVKSDSILFDKMTLANLPLPNIYQDGSICMGSTRIENQENIQSKGQLVMAVWDLFLNSNWNLDLMFNKLFPSNLEDVYRTLPEHAVNTAPACSDTTLRLLKLLDCMHDDNAYMKLNWTGTYAAI